MTENIPPVPQPTTASHPQPTTTSQAADVPGLPFYEKSRAHLRDLLRRQTALQRSLLNLEDTITRKEGEYLEDTPAGNIIVGFEGYVKGGGIGGGGGGRRERGGGGGGRNGGWEGLRVFSRSSVSFRPAGEGVDSPLDTGTSTPGNGAPTPVSGSFLKGEEKGSGNATPTSTTAGGNKKKKAVTTVPGEDSETDGRESKKVRTGFGTAVRK